MSLLDYIEKIQQKPYGSRVRILIMTVGIIMVIIITGWIQVTRHALSFNTSKEEVQKIIQPITLLWESAKDGFTDFKSRLPKFQF